MSSAVALDVLSTREQFVSTYSCNYGPGLSLSWSMVRPVTIDIFDFHCYVISCCVVGLN